ncbi:MAG: 50S ribosomal protein L25, partial [Pseudomonadota bacterium]
MSETETLVSEPRDRLGKGGARAARRAGRLPAVIYGGDEAPSAITLDFNTVRKAYFAGQLMGRLTTIWQGDRRDMQAVADLGLGQVQL